ncbi:MAG: hypothetical protein AABX55_00080 [Nanoarchaeota archaeon]
MLTKNQLLCEICEIFPNFKPNWDEIVERFKNIRMNRKGDFSFNTLASYLAESYVRLTLEEICTQYEGRIFIDQIPNGASKSGYTYHYSDVGHTGLIVSKNNIYHCEIDELLLVDGLPVLVEVKVGRYRFPDVINTMIEYRINQISNPIKQYFETDRCGYMLVIPSDQIISDENILKDKKVTFRRFIQKEFREKNGVLVPFYTTRKIFRREVRKIEKDYSL